MKDYYTYKGQKPALLGHSVKLMTQLEDKDRYANVFVLTGYLRGQSYMVNINDIIHIREKVKII